MGEGHRAQIFQEDPGGSIEIDLVYDNRQAAMDKLKKISRGIDDAKASYDDLMSLYNDLKPRWRGRMPPIQYNIMHTWGT